MVTLDLNDENKEDQRQRSQINNETESKDENEGRNSSNDPVAPSRRQVFDGVVEDFGRGVGSLRQSDGRLRQGVGIGRVVSGIRAGPLLGQFSHFAVTKFRG